MDFVKIKLQNSPNETEYSDRGQLLNAVSRLKNAVKHFLAMLRMRSGYWKDALGSEEFNAFPIVFVGSLQIILHHQTYPTRRHQILVYRYWGGKKGLFFSPPTPKSL